jgi:hypothetical protein
MLRRDRWRRERRVEGDGSIAAEVRSMAPTPRERRGRSVVGFDFERV